MWGSYFTEKVLSNTYTCIKHRTIEEGLHKPRLWIDPKELTGYLKEEIDRFDFGKKDDKCHILDFILDTFPENLKAYAEDICNTLKCRNDILINHNWEVFVHGYTIQGYTIRGSNIYTMIVNELTRRGKSLHDLTNSSNVKEAFDEIILIIL